MVRFENVGMRYGMGPEVLHDVTFAIEPGEFRYLVGPSGAGKTSLLRLMYLGRLDGQKPLRCAIEPDSPFHLLPACSSRPAFSCAKC